MVFVANLGYFSICFRVYVVKKLSFKAFSTAEIDASA